MKVLNFGSLNIDYVYSVLDFVEAGQTISSTKRECFCGGKGLNQSVAFARAGAEVYHAGCIGPEGGMLEDMLKSAGVDTHLLKHVDSPCGHAIIQVNARGNNCILLYGGANRLIDDTYIDRVMSEFGQGDLLVLQNEINDDGKILKKAKELGMKAVLNPSPFDDSLNEIDFSLLDYIILNETEGFALTGKRNPYEILADIRKKYPHITAILTLGCDGAMCDDGKEIAEHPIFSVTAVDTTAAGDTFTGFFMTAIMNGSQPYDALRRASAASAISVSRKGAAPSVPSADEVVDFIISRN